MYLDCVSFMKQDNVTKSLVETYPPRTHEEILAEKEIQSPKRKCDQIKREGKVIKQEFEPAEFHAYEDKIGFHVDARHGEQSGEKINEMSFFKN